MKTKILGYPDERGLGKSVTVMDENSSAADQIKFISDAKATGVLPDGVEKLAHCTVEEHTIALRWGDKPETKTKKKN